MIDDAQGLGDGGGTMPFRLWNRQVQVMWLLMRERLVVVLKARQLGISWLVCAYVLWKCCFVPGQEVLLFSKGQKEANELIRRIGALYNRLPRWMLEALPAVMLPTSKSGIMWSNGSRVQSMPATRSSGISFTASVVVMDEAAHMNWGQELYNSVKPTIDAGGQLIVLSTAAGAGGFFHGLWDRADRGLNAFRTVFLPWWTRPGRDRAWYDRMLAQHTQPRLVRQEYPANPTEAFLTSGRTRFENEWVLAQDRNVRPPLPRRQWPAALTKDPGYPFGRNAPPFTSIPDSFLYAYAPPRPGRFYVGFMDVAEGKDPQGSDDPDWNALVVVDDETWEEVLTYHCRCQPDEFAKHAVAVACQYKAVVIPERNNHGHAVLATFRLLKFPLLRGRVAGPGYGVGHDGFEGWITNVQTKPQMVDLLGECLRDDLVTVRHRPTVDELLRYSVLRNGATGALPGRHDDLVMAWAGVLAFARDRRNRTSGPPLVAGERFKVKNFIGPG